MAAETAKKSDSGKDRSSSLVTLVLPILLLTIIAGGGGFALGSLNLGKHNQDPQISVDENKTNEVSGENSEQGAEKSANKNGATDKNSIVKKLPTIVTNLMSPSQVWIRLEVSIIIKPEAENDQDIIAVEASDRIVSLLRGVKLSNIESASGFIHLRQDISDILTTSSEGKISQVLINSLVVE